MNTVLTPLLAMTAWFLGLSILVQVLQELWKYVTSSKSRAYEQALADFLGPFFVRRLKQDPALSVRGPLQFRRVSIAGRVLPLNADDLVSSIEKNAPEWHRVMKGALEFEASIQKSGPAPPSTAFREALAALEHQVDEARSLRRDSSDRRLSAETLALGDAGRVHAFLAKWNATGTAGDGRTDTPQSIDAATLRRAFVREFLPQEETIERHYDQFLQNFSYQYRRRNLRQTFTLAMLVAIVLNLPFEQIFVRATAVTPEQAIALAENARALYQQAAEAGDDQARLREVGNQALAIASSATSLVCGPRDTGLTTDVVVTTEQAAARQATAQNVPYTCENALNLDYFLDPVQLWQRLFDRRNGSPRFLFGCFLTAVLVTFGAPFWNDLSSSLLRVARPSRGQQTVAAPDRPVKTEME
jgi:hypothetical protein